MLLWVLEDDKDLRNLILSVAATRGHQGLAFATLVAARTMLRESYIAPNLVICSLMLDGQSSESWMLAVRVKFPLAKLVCFSGSLDPETTTRLNRHGIHAIPKPASLLPLFKLLEK